MAEFLGREDLGSYLRTLERRVLALETSRRPSQTFVDVVPVDPVGVDSDTYETVFRVRLDVVTAPVLEVGLQASADGIAQGVWRLQVAGGSLTSGEVPFAGVAANYATSLTFPAGLVGTSLAVNVQVRRTTGSSFVYLSYPFVAMLDYGLTTSDVT
jgi:hypothetical protein